LSKHPQGGTTPNLPPADFREPTDVAAEISRIIGGHLPRKRREVIVARVASLMVSETFSGPLPHPNHLSGYEQIAPGAAERIITMAEKRQNHLHEMDQGVLRVEAKDRKLGMWLGFGAFALLVSGAVVTAFTTESEVVPVSFLCAAALGAIKLFVRGRANR